MGKLKTLLKNTCEGVHLLADFKLFIVIFVGIISWKGVHVSMGEIHNFSCFIQLVFHYYILLRYLKKVLYK